MPKGHEIFLETKYPANRNLSYSVDRRSTKLFMAILGPQKVLEQNKKINENDETYRIESDIRDRVCQRSVTFCNARLRKATYIGCSPYRKKNVSLPLPAALDIPR